MDNLHIYPQREDVAQAAAERLVTAAADAIAQRGQFSVGLPGGSTPRLLFQLLASQEFALRIEWPRVHIFWGDERCVPPDHPASNFRMARETLLDHVPLLPEHIHRIEGELEPSHAATQYETRLRRFFKTVSWPRFDLLLQGMGTDGHTASLFPETAALDESTRWVLENYVPKLDAWRITLTAPAINAASQIMFLVTGQEKASTLRLVLKGPHEPRRYPAQLIRPQTGQLIWLVDEAAAADL